MIYRPFVNATRRSNNSITLPKPITTLHRTPGRLTKPFFKAHHQPHPLWQLDRFIAPDQDPDHCYEYAIGLVPVWADDYDQAVTNRAHHDPRADLQLVLHRWEYFQDGLLTAYPLALTTRVLA